MKKVLIIILICQTILLSGCEGRIELNELSMVTMMGIDWDSVRQEYQITLNVVRFSRTSQQSLNARNNSWIATASGKTLRDAVTNIDARASRRHSGTALSVVLIGKSAGEHGIEVILDFLERNREYRDTINVFSTDTQASEIMKVLPEHEKDIQKEIEGTAEHGDWLRSYAPTLRQVYVDYNERNGDIITGAVYMASPTPYDGIPRKESSNVENPDNTDFVIGCAVYNKGKLVGFLNDIDTRSYLLVTRKGKQVSSKTDVIPNITDENGKINASLEIKSLSSNTEISNLDNEITMNIFVNLDASLDEMTTPTNVDENTIRILKELLNKNVKEQIEAMLNKTKTNFNTDVIGVYNALHEKYPQVWKKDKNRWDEVYPNVNFNVTVNSEVTKTGLLINSIEAK